MYSLKCASCRTDMGVKEWAVRGNEEYRCKECGKLNRTRFNQDFFAHYETVIVEEKTK